MESSLSRSLLSAAKAGIMLGALTACSGNPEGAKSAADEAPPKATGGQDSDAVADRHAADAKACCKAMNECRGKGGCKTDANECAGKNACKGQGGCNGHCPQE